jgi:hypothetical protein
LAGLYAQYYKYVPSGYNDKNTSDSKEILCEIDDDEVENSGNA